MKSRNPQSSWQNSCQHQEISSAKYPRLELVPESTRHNEPYLPEVWRRTQEELLWYRQLYENIPSLYFTLDEKGIILSVNQFGASELGYAQEELIHKSVYDLFAKTEGEQLLDCLTELLKDTPDSSVRTWELRLNYPRSHIVWLKVNVRILLNSDNNHSLTSNSENPVILMVCEDITARKQSESDLRNSESMFHVTTDTAPVMLWMTGCDGLYDYFNHYWLEFTGKTTEQEQGDGWLLGVHPDDRNTCEIIFNNAFNKQNKFQREYRLLSSDGSYRWMLDTGMPRFSPDGEFAGYIGCCVDITERKQAEVDLQQSQSAAQAQLAKMESVNRLKDEFLSTVSHELRTPLTNMKMAIQMLGIALNKQSNQALYQQAQFGPDKKIVDSPTLATTNSKIARYFQILNNECEREINLINNFLDLQRLDSTVKPLVMETIQIEEWLYRAVKMFKARSTSCRQSLQVNIPALLPSLVSDPYSLERILIELLTNACKFSPEDGNILVSARATSEHILLEVSNSGVEIPPEEMSKIFDKFYRIPSNDPWKQGGTGLGLALVQKITKYLGGTITVRSLSNTTYFTVQLPLDKGMGSGE